MKKIILPLLVALFAFSSAYAADLKIGVVSIGDIMKTAPQVTSMNAKIKKDFGPRQAKLLASQKTLQADLEKYKKNASVMKETDRKALTDKITTEQGNFQQMSTTFQRDLQTERNKMMTNFLHQVQNVITSLAKKQQFDIVLTESNVPYYSKSLDITSDVMKALK